MTRRDDWLLHQLPVGMAEDPFLVNFVTIFQRVANTAVHQIDTLPHAFDPHVAPLPMVRLMGAWLGVTWIDSTLPESLQRRIVGEYSQIVQWRGTKRGMLRLLGLLSGGAEVTVTDSGGTWRENESPHSSPHVRLEMESVAEWLSVDDLIRVVRAELPATVSFDLWVAGRRVYPGDPTPPAAVVGRLPEPAGSPNGGFHG